MGELDRYFPAVIRYHMYFNPRAPVGELDYRMKRFYKTYKDISIHGPREGADYLTWFVFPYSLQFQFTAPAREPTLTHAVVVLQERKFQSTAPAREPTGDITQINGGEIISIHGPREGADPASRRHTAIRY